MNMSAFFRLGLCAWVLGMMAASCSADMFPIGEPVPGSSWTQRFQESGKYHDEYGPVSFLAIKMDTTEDAFEAPTMANFTDSSWTLLYENDFLAPTIASSEGPAVSTLQWDCKFTGNRDNPLIYKYVAYNGDSLRGGGTCSWNGSTWTCTEGPYPLTWEPTRTEVVPEPGTLAMLIVGGIVAGSATGIRRRREKE
jgi:hypothetical protein